MFPDEVIDDQIAIPQCSPCLYEGVLENASAIYALATCKAHIYICNRHAEEVFAAWAGKVTPLQ